MTYRQYIALLRNEYRSRHEGQPPPDVELLREPWVAECLRVIFPGFWNQAGSPAAEATTPCQSLVVG